MLSKSVSSWCLTWTFKRKHRLTCFLRKISTETSIEMKWKTFRSRFKEEHDERFTGWDGSLFGDIDQGGGKLAILTMERRHLATMNEERGCLATLTERKRCLATLTRWKGCLATLTKGKGCLAALTKGRRCLVTLTKGRVFGYFDQREKMFGNPEERVSVFGDIEWDKRVSMPFFCSHSLRWLLRRLSEAFLCFMQVFL